MRKVQMDTGFQISLFLLRVFSFSLYIIIFMYSLGFAKIGCIKETLHGSHHPSTTEEKSRTIQAPFTQTP